MPVPNLLHKTLITIRQQNRAQTEWDDDAREAIQVVKKDSDLKLYGQVSFMGAGRGDMNLEYHRRGVNEGGLGYILFRYVDLDDLGVTIQRNDQVVQIGRRAVDLWVERVTPVGHYEDQDGPTMLKAHITDRKPARNNPGE